MRKNGVLICLLSLFALVAGCTDTIQDKPPLIHDNVTSVLPSPTPEPTPRATEDFGRYLADHTAHEIDEGIVCGGDLDGDGAVEYVFRQAADDRGVNYYLLHKLDTGMYVNAGILPDDYSVGHVITDTHIRRLDTGAEQYIVLDVAHDMANAYGYFIYGYDGVNILGPLINFPGATAYGARELTDSDGDGVYEHTDYYRKDDLQRHLLTVKTPFCRDQLLDRSLTESEYSEYMLSYENTAGRFIYPNTPEEVIRCYIEAKWLFEQKPQEILDELSAITCTPKQDIGLLTFDPLNAKYNGIEIQLEILSETDDTGTISASDARGNHIIFTVVAQDGKWRIREIHGG